MTKTTKQPKVPTFKLIEGAKGIEAAIASIAKRGKSLQNDIHVAAVSTLSHADKHGDITLAIRLIEAVPTLARKNALKDWYIAFGKFSYDMQSKEMKFNKKGTTKLEQAMQTPFWDFKAEAEYKPFDFKAAVLQLVAKAEKAAEKGEATPEQVAALRQLTA